VKRNRTVRVTGHLATQVVMGNKEYSFQFQSG